jgi:peptide-methionine (S)-S-oxide reductase
MELCAPGLDMPGGSTANPTYHSLGDHTETVQIDFDPTRVSYEKLLTVFWKGHNPGSRSWSRQYKAIVFFHNEEQKRLALESRDRLAAEIKGKIYTEVLPFSGFYLAEAYHQKYQLQQDSGLMREFRAIYPDARDFVNSTAAARVNGYLGGYGTPDELRRDLTTLGLSEAGAEKLLDRVKRHGRGGWF